MAPSEHKIRVLVFNRYGLFREGLKAMLPHGGPIEIVAEAVNGKQALRIAERLHPDVVLVDTTLADSVTVTRGVKQIDPHIKVLIVSLQDDEGLVAECLAAGAIGCVRKDAHPEQLRRAIQNACRGATYAA